ncbi:enterochelin esterase [Streptomyces sp. CA-132043]|uniref:enterochelin esterase n=1 Tax=Streptomyces sp. CA-132043 TaxID=3240048 RepID=UPI003D8B4E82
MELLRERLATTPAGDRAALVEAFWAAAQQAGTPLIEPLPDAPDHRAVTFLWRGEPGTRQVLLVANRLGDREHLAGSLLSRLPGTDIWYLTYRLRDDHRGSYRMAADTGPHRPPTDPRDLQSHLRALTRHAVPDPLNKETLASRWDQTQNSVFALPHAPPQPWAGRRAGIARGRTERHRVTSRALGCDREVWAYLPPGGHHDDLPVLVLGDGDMWFGKLDLQDTLDALIADAAVPPFAVLAPHAVDNATRWQELGGRDAYVTFLADEVLPWAATRRPVTADPARTVVAGQSLGGVTALYACLTRPDRFGNALAHSPSLWWRPGLAAGIPKETAAAPPWLLSRYAQAEQRPLRVRLDVGLHEGTMVDQARALHDTLRSLRYDVTLTEFNGGHDYACWRGALADGLAHLLGDAPA